MDYEQWQFAQRHEQMNEDISPELTSQLDDAFAKFSNDLTTSGTNAKFILNNPQVQQTFKMIRAEMQGIFSKLEKPAKKEIKMSGYPYKVRQSGNLLNYFLWALHAGLSPEDLRNWTNIPPEIAQKVKEFYPKSSPEIKNMALHAIAQWQQSRR